MVDLSRDSEPRRPVLHLNPRAWGISVGLVFALGLFGATVVLILQGAPSGQEVGPHLGSLSYFFPGYSVTWTGSLVGLAYGFVLGYALGRSVGSIYNKLVEGFPA